jgi:hypothetical protein
VGTTDQISVPCPQSFRRGDRRDFVQRLAIKPFRFGRQPPSLVIVKLQTPITHLFSKDAILLDEVYDDLLLMAAHPSADGKHDKRKWIKRRAHGQYYDRARRWISSSLSKFDFLSRTGIRNGGDRSSGGLPSLPQSAEFSAPNSVPQFGDFCGAPLQ